MNRHLAVAVVVVLCLGLFCSFSTLNNQAQAQGKAAPAEQKITVLSPMGTPPPIKLKTMPPRLATLEGKTIYMYDTQWGGPDAAASVYEEMQGWFARNMPSVKTEIYKGTGWMSDDKGFVKKVAANKVDGVIIGIAG